MSFEYSKLLGRITEKFGSQLNFSNAMKISERSISLKLNNRVPWKQTEIIQAINLLDLEKKDIPEYFFE